MDITLKNSKPLRNMLCISAVLLSLSACVYGGGYNDYEAGFSGNEYCDPYNEYDAYYGCDVEYGFANIGFGGGWHQDFYYPGFGFFLFDRGGNRFRMNNYYQGYWGNRRRDYFRTRFANRQFSGQRLRRFDRNRAIGRGPDARGDNRSDRSEPRRGARQGQRRSDRQADQGNENRQNRRGANRDNNRADRNQRRNPAAATNPPREGGRRNQPEADGNRQNNPPQSSPPDRKNPEARSRKAQEKSQNKPRAKRSDQSRDRSQQKAQKSQSERPKQDHKSIPKDD